MFMVVKWGVLAVLASTPPLASTSPTWDTVTSTIDANADFSDLVFRVGTAASPDPVFEYVKGAQFTAESSISFASATKLLTASCLMTLVDEGLLSLSDKPSKFLAWWTTNASDERSQITLEHLLSFTSGLANGVGSTKADDPCLGDNTVAFDACVRAIYDNNQVLASAPGTMFVYGGNHMQIAAAMGLAAKNVADFNELLAQQVWRPLGLTPTPLKIKVLPLSNPQAAGRRRRAEFVYKVHNLLFYCFLL